MEINITLLLQIAIFLFLLAWLSKFLFSPLQELWAERERRIEGAKYEARTILARAENTEASIKIKIKDAQLDAKEEFYRLKEEGAAQYRAMVEQAKRAAKLEVDESSAALKLEVDKARKILKTEVSSIADEILLSIVNKKQITSSPKNNSGKLEFKSV